MRGDFRLLSGVSPPPPLQLEMSHINGMNNKGRGTTGVLTAAAPGLGLQQIRTQKELGLISNGNTFVWGCS